jgi:hypothetical protein
VVLAHILFENSMVFANEYEFSRGDNEWRINFMEEILFMHFGWRVWQR